MYHRALDEESSDLSKLLPCKLTEAARSSRASQWFFSWLLFYNFYFNNIFFISHFGFLSMQTTEDRSAVPVGGGVAAPTASRWIKSDKNDKAVRLGAPFNPTEAPILSSEEVKSFSLFYGSSLRPSAPFCLNIASFFSFFLSLSSRTKLTLRLFHLCTSFPSSRRSLMIFSAEETAPGVLSISVYQ